MEVASGTSGTGPESINSAVQLSQTSCEKTVKQVAEKPGNNLILLPHEEDIVMKESDTISDQEMEEVEKYFDSLPLEKPSLELLIKNTYSGSGPIASYNNDNQGATVILAQNAVYKQMQTELIEQKHANMVLQQQIQLLTQQMQDFMNNQNTTLQFNKLSAKRSLEDLNKLDSDLYLTQDKVDSFNNQLKQVQNNINIHINKLNDNIEYNQKILEETQKAMEEDKQLILAQKKNIDDLNNKIIQISNANALTIKGKLNEDEVSKTKINQCNQELKSIKVEINLKFHMQNELVNQYNNVEESLKTFINQLNHFQDKIDEIENQK